jgi:hypothetical protein
VTDSYRKYFAAIEEHFRCLRGTGWFLLSAQDYKLVEMWHGMGVPLETVLRGIDKTFENWWKGSTRGRNENVNSLSYCARTVSEEASIVRSRWSG